MEYIKIFFKFAAKVTDVCSNIGKWVRKSGRIIAKGIEKYVDSSRCLYAVAGKNKGLIESIVEAAKEEKAVISKVTEGVTQAGESSIKNIYDSIKKAPQYPEGFKGIANGTRKVNIKNGDVLDELRKVESGQWKKVYKDGYDVSGKKISIHYFQSQSGKVFNVKVKPGWSNK